MATNFPSSLDLFTNPSSTDAMDSVSVPHADQHANLNDAVEAVQAKVGADGSTVTSSLDYKVAQQGLTLVKTQTVGSGVSSVTVTNAFSSTFDNYKIVYHGGSGSGFGSLLMTLGSTTTDYYWGRYFVFYSGGSISSSGGSADSSWSVGTIQNFPNLTMLSVDLFGPYLSVSTMMQLNVRLSGVSGAAGGGGGFLNSTTSYTSFTLTASANTMTGGTIRVYGYNNG